MLLGVSRNNDINLLAEKYLQIYEANIFSKDPIKTVISDITKDKGISDERIINWLNKSEEKFFQVNSNDEENLKSGNIKKHAMQQNDPSWASNSYDIVYTPQRIDFLKHVVDYFKTRDEDYLKNLFKKTPGDIYNKEIPAWELELKTSKKQVTTDFKLDVDYRILKQWPNGMKIVQPLTQKVCDAEGSRMGHCAGTYKPSQIQSLWDAKNEPHVTLEIGDKGNTIHQIKGKGNAAPVDKYKPYIIQYIKDNKFVIKADGENIDMISYNNKYYWPNTQEWEDIYNKKIVPKQNERIKDILAHITTINENYRRSFKLHFNKYCLIYNN